MSTPEGRTQMLLSFYFRHPQVFESKWAFQRNLLELTEGIAKAYDSIDPDKRASLQISDNTTFLISYASGDQFDEKTQAINKLKNQLTQKLKKFNISSPDITMSQWAQTLNKEIKTLADAYVLLPLLFDVNGTQRDNPEEHIQNLTREAIENTYSDSLPQHYRVPFMTALGQNEQEFNAVINKFKNAFEKNFLNQATQVTKSGQSRKKEALSIEKMPAAFSSFRCFGGDCPVQSVPFHGLEKDVSVYLIRKNDRVKSQPEAYAFVKNVNGIPYVITIDGKLNSSQVSQIVRLITHDFGTKHYYISKNPQGLALVNKSTMEEGLRQGALEETLTINLGPGWKQIDRATTRLKMTRYRNYYSKNLLQEVEKRRSVPGDSEEVIQQKTRPSSYPPQSSLKHRPLKERALLAARLWSQKKGDLSAFLATHDLSQEPFEAAQILTEIENEFFLMPNDFLSLKKHLNYEIKDLTGLPLLNQIPSYWHLWESFTPLEKQWLKNHFEKLKKQLEKEMNHQGIELTEKRSQLLKIAQISMEVLEKLVNEQEISEDFLHSLKPLLKKVTPHAATELNAKGVLELHLRQEGVDPNVKNNNGETLLCRAAGFAKVDIASLLLERGAHPNMKDTTNETALHQAAYVGNIDIGALLLEKGADPNVKDNSGYTPLYWAADNGHVDMVALLLEKGADPSVKNNSGYTPLHSATSEGHTHIVTLLKNHQKKKVTSRPDVSRSCWSWLLKIRDLLMR